MSCFDMGEYEAAERYADEAIGLFETMDAEWGLCYMLSIKGATLRLLGRLEEASATLTQARELNTSVYPAQHAHLEDALGGVTLARSDAHKAVAHFAEGVQVAIRVGSPLAQYQMLTNQGLAEIAAGLFDLAELHFNRMLAFFDASPAAASEQCFGAMCRIVLARIVADTGRVTLACELLHTAQVVVDAYPASFDAHVREVMKEARQLVTNT